MPPRLCPGCAAPSWVCDNGGSPLHGVPDRGVRGPRPAGCRLGARSAQRLVAARRKSSRHRSGGRDARVRPTPQRQPLACHGHRSDGARLDGKGGQRIRDPHSDGHERVGDLHGGLDLGERLRRTPHQQQLHLRRRDRRHLARACCQRSSRPAALGHRDWSRQVGGGSCAALSRRAGAPEQPRQAIAATRLGDAKVPRLEPRPFRRARGRLVRGDGRIGGTQPQRLRGVLQRLVRSGIDRQAGPGSARADRGRAGMANPPALRRGRPGDAGRVRPCRGGGSGLVRHRARRGASARRRPLGGRDRGARGGSASRGLAIERCAGAAGQVHAGRAWGIHGDHRGGRARSHHATRIDPGPLRHRLRAGAARQDGPGRPDAAALRHGVAAQAPAHPRRGRTRRRRRCGRSTALLVPDATHGGGPAGGRGCRVHANRGVARPRRTHHGRRRRARPGRPEPLTGIARGQPCHRLRAHHRWHRSRTRNRREHRGERCFQGVAPLRRHVPGGDDQYRTGRQDLGRRARRGLERRGEVRDPIAARSSRGWTADEAGDGDESPHRVPVQRGPQPGH